MKINKKKFVINIYGSGSEKNSLIKKYNNEKIIWHEYINEEELFKEYNKTNFFLLPLDATGRQKYIIPGKFSSYLFFCRPIIGFSNKNSALEDYICQNKLGVFIDIDQNSNDNAGEIEKLFNHQKEYYETQYNNIQKFYDDNFSIKTVNEQIKKIFT